MSITTTKISKRFGNVTVLDDVSVEVPTGSLVALLGPSGSGKTTLLRIIAGLEVPDSGSVRYSETDVTGHAPKDRNVGFVFQHYALFRHMTVFENVAFALRVRGWPNAKVRERVHELMHLVRLEGFERRYPSEISGGQRQRVALIRALAAEPRILLLDEPFAALDAKVRHELRTELLRLHEETHVTSLFVTHDQEEAFEVADRVVVMNHGKVEQAGTPGEVFENPANDFVMDFLGNVNVFHARLTNGRAHLTGGAGGGAEIPYPAYPHEKPHETRLYVRPHEFSIDRSPAGDGQSLRARVMHINPAGSVVKVRLLADGFDLVVNVDVSPTEFGELGLEVGESVYVSPQRVRVFLPAADYSI